jgi:hypothetical protein
MGNKNRERRQRRDAQRKARRAAPKNDARRRRPSRESDESKTVRLWHGTTTTVVPASPQDFDLKSAAQHQGPSVWESSIAPRDLIYLGDAVSLVFARLAMDKLGGNPVLLDVEVPRSALRSDPSYLKALQHPLIQGAAGYGTDVSSSFRWSGRVAAVGPVDIRQRWVCDKPFEFRVRLAELELAKHAQSWQDDRSWKQASEQPSRAAKSGGEWRAHIGKLIVDEFFEPY